jgi:hypothetical protein
LGARKTLHRYAMDGEGSPFCRQFRARSIQFDTLADESRLSRKEFKKSSGPAPMSKSEPAPSISRSTRGK